jgi:hypothetical protein
MIWREVIRNIPKDLMEALDFLKSFEKSNDHSKRTRYFEDAIEILNNHLQDTPETLHKVFIENLKLTYTRKLLEQLPLLSTLDIDDWTKYLMLLIQSVPNETEALSKEHSQLRQNKEAFIAIWINETIAALQRISKQSKDATK